MRKMPGLYRYSEADARKLIEIILDAGSFTELFTPCEHLTSPHLKALNYPVEFDDGVVVGIGKLKGKKVYMAAQQGKFDGGSIGEIHAAKITGLLKRAKRDKPDGVIVAFDSGGVRLHEANIGLIGVAEIIRAVLDVRTAEIPCIALVGGQIGCYGGASLTAPCFDYIVMNERGRTGVSGPMVIETNLGVEELDSQDKSLVWHIFGGKHRFAMGDADVFVDDDISAFRDAAADLLKKPRKINLRTMEAEQKRLSIRLGKFGKCSKPEQIWKKCGITDPCKISMAETREFLKLCRSMKKKP